MNHEVNDVKVDDDSKDSGNISDNELLAFMAGQGSSSGDIRQVLAAKKAHLIRARIEKQTKAS
jgi:hypothetical protein